MSTPDRSSQHGLARRRVGLAVAVGGVVAGVAAPLLPWEVTSLLGWDAAIAVFLFQVWPNVLGLSADDVAEHATTEDDSRPAAELVLVGASVVSLVGVALTLVEAADHPGLPQGLITVLSVVTVGLSWMAVHTVFTLRYASLYYGDEPGGIDFGEERHPDYRDIAYVAFTVGMTYQVSDTRITNADVRRTVLKHALLSYIFGTGVVAVTINVVAGFLR